MGCDRSFSDHTMSKIQEAKLLKLKNKYWQSRELHINLLGEAPPMLWHYSWGNNTVLATSDFETEFKNFLRDIPPPLDVNPADWWKFNGDRFPSGKQAAHTAHLSMLTC